MNKLFITLIVAFVGVAVFAFGAYVGATAEHQKHRAEVQRHELTVQRCNDMIDLMQIAANDFASGLTQQGHEVYQEVEVYRKLCK